MISPINVLRIVYVDSEDRVVYAEIISRAVAVAAENRVVVAVRASDDESQVA